MKDASQLSSTNDKKSRLKQILEDQGTNRLQKEVSKSRGSELRGTRADRRDFGKYPEFLAHNRKKSIFIEQKIDNPYFRINETITSDKIQIAGQKLISFSSYNYLGLSEHTYVKDQAKKSIDRYGTSPSASRIVSGEKPIHVELERKIADFLGTEDAVVFANGFATNVTVIGHFVNSRDVIIYDELSHNSIIEGCILSGARRIPFAHNDIAMCEKHIRENIDNYEKILVVIEGAYSMDGDVARLRDFVELRNKHNILLYVDEAHSLGCLGATGRGICEYSSVDPNNVDFLMGTLSKACASNGGYIAGKSILIDYLKYTTPGFVYSAGMSPANAAAALAALEVMEEDVSRVVRLQTNARYFRSKAKACGLDTGLSHDTPIVPIIIGDTLQTIKLADRLFKSGVCVHPIFHPIVPEGEARLRFFITSEHSEEQMNFTINNIKQHLLVG